MEMDKGKQQLGGGGESESVWKDAEVEDDVSQEAFITLPPPVPFTKARVDAVERRPAAVLNTCQFLNVLSNQCKVDLAKLGCPKIHHNTQAANEKSEVDTSRTPSHRHRRHSKETWDKRMLRLKVYQRAFSAIVIHFKAYCPPLFYIKKTYEDMLNYRINQIKLSHFEKKRLHIQMLNMKQQMSSYQFPEYPQLLKAEKYLAILRQRIGMQDEAIKVITGILNKMEQSLSDHFERHRDLEEQVIMVDAEIANRRQKAFSMREKEEKDVKEKSGNATNTDNNAVSLLDSDEEDLDDPYYNIDDVEEERRMVWIMAFAICHKDLEDAEKKLNFFQTKYQHVVPRHEHENMKRTIKDEISVAKALTDEKAQLEEELMHLKESESSLGEVLGEIKSQLTDLRTLVTPRPSWEDLGEFIPGGLPKWEKMIQGRSTKEVTERLFSELRSRRGGDKYIQNLGVEPNVMRCLRYGHKVLDRQIHSRDAALIIHDTWMSRKKALLENLHAPVKTDEYDFGKPVENPATKNFPTFVAIHFEEMYEDLDLRMEWTYNLVESCKRFSRDYRLTQFFNILQQQCDENLYFVTHNELLRVRNTLLQKSVDEEMSKGTLSSNQFVEALELAYPGKPESELQAIVRVTNKLNAELNQGEDADLSTYHITQLVDVRDDGFRGVFVSEVVKQFEEGRKIFIDRIIEEIAKILDISPLSASKETDPAADKDVTVMQVYRGIKNADSDIGDEKIGAALAWIFTLTSVLIGGGISTSRLINYVKLHSDDDSGEGSDLTQADDDKFERAIKDILREEEEGESKMSEAQMKSFYKALKHAKLRTVVKRLKGCALIPSWQTYDPTDSLLPDGPVDLEKDLGRLQVVPKKTMVAEKVPAPDDGTFGDDVELPPDVPGSEAEAEENA